VNSSEMGEGTSRRPPRRRDRVDTIKVWDLEEGEDSVTLRGHARAVRSLALSGDSKRLFSASSDNDIKILDLEAGKEVLRYVGTRGPIWTLT
jgi:WD40 repeat protein